MPSPWATARASSMAETPQQALNASSGSGSQAGHRFIVRPMTSWPSAASNAAATELSTPPLIATAHLATLYLLATRPGTKEPWDQASRSSLTDILILPVTVNRERCQTVAGLLVPWSRGLL